MCVCATSKSVVIYCNFKSCCNLCTQEQTSKLLAKVKEAEVQIGTCHNRTRIFMGSQTLVTKVF